MSENKVNLQEIINYRLEKIKTLKDGGVNPFPHNFNLKDKVSDLLLEKEPFNKNYQTAGRIVSMRKMGKVCFCHIQDEGHKIQVYIKNNLLEEGMYDLLVRNLDIGDIVGFNGVLFYTKTNELSIKCNKVTMLAKSIRPLPNIKEKEGESFFSFEDKELRYRNRHLDLIVNPLVRDVFVSRSKIINQMRSFLNEKDYLEVETPVLQPIYGGANARPFTTFHNTLDEKLYLRISLELYLKKIIIGGINKVYELSKNFRNEGMDKNHNPEFTMLEFYSAYSDVYDMMELTEEMVKVVLKKSINSEIVNFNKNEISFKKKFKIIDFFDSIKQFSKKDVSNMNNKQLYQFLNDSKIKIEKNANYGNLIDKIFSHFVEPNLIEPTFIINFPKEISPLAKTHRDNEELVERFELFIGGMEIANSFTELNDPIDQIERLNAQVKLRAKGDKEAQVVDHSFIEAMESGMPPTGGVGIGIDRLVMLFTNNTSIKDVTLFPAMR
ncbi:MAG: lysine--tRNA ligase [Candidatus Marinimicrobia bacterium]|nr:lysine--tRNA ligase [Candidatus Neomarinimicrobiota bacterium]